MFVLEKQDSGRRDQRLDHCFHDRRTDAIAEEPDAVATAPCRQLEVFLESHGPLEFRHLEHPHARFAPMVKNQGEAIQGRDRTQWTVQGLPPARAVIPIVHEEKTGSLPEHLESALRPLQGGNRPAFVEQCGRLPCVGRVEHGLGHATRAAALVNFPNRRTGAITDEKQPPAALRNTEIGRVQHMLFQTVPKIPEAAAQLSIPRPRPHMDDILQNKPSRTQRTGVFDDEHGRRTAGFVSRGSPLGTGVIRAFRGREEDVDLPDIFP